MKAMLLVMAIILVNASTMAQKNHTTPLMLKAAQESLKTIKQLIGAEGPDANFIFVSLSGENKRAFSGRRIDTNSLVLLHPIFVSLIRLDSLKNYRKGEPIEHLILYTHKVIFPVVSQKDNVMSTIVLDSLDGRWATSLGDEKEVIQNSISHFLEAKTPSEILKQPNLNLYFTPIMQQKHTMLMPLQNSARMELLIGKSELMDNVLSKMAKDAQSIQNVPN